MTTEQIRLKEDHERKVSWKRWGPYLSERQWSTVREDYSPHGEVWDSFPHDHARSRAYRWGEDGLLGFCDRQCRLAFGLALWNGKDPILKERLFGLTGPQGNHGEDVKECYYYLESTPTHSYAKALYKYPQAEYPYEHLVRENAQRSVTEPELELEETGVFDESRYFDVFAEYAKHSAEDLCIRITIANRGPDAATMHLLPTLWLRNTWSWGESDSPARPSMKLVGRNRVEVNHETLGDYIFTWKGEADLLFTENETNRERLWETPNETPFVKDAFHNAVIHGKADAVNPDHEGTKFAPHFILSLGAGEEQFIELRLTQKSEERKTPFGEEFDQVFEDRKADLEEFHQDQTKTEMSDEAQLVARQARAGLLWTKQFYYYVIEDWLKGDPDQPPPPKERYQGRNKEWSHFHARDILSMPDAWEYPWFAAWDSAFHMIPFASIDPYFAKSQIELFLREWYMHPNGQIPAYEFAFGDVNPPVHAWAAWRIYKMTGANDRGFLERTFQKLLLNFTWWVNRKDADGNNLFQGGFLGLDNIGVFDRSKELPVGGYLEQADGTAWMGFYALTMLSMALELAQENSAYEDLASKFFEHYIAIADSLNHLGGDGLWDEEDGIYYDKLKLGDESIPLRTRSLVGLLPLIAVEILEDKKIENLKGFTKRMDWFIEHRPELGKQVTLCQACNTDGRRILAMPSQERLERTLRYMFDEAEFLSQHGIRSLSKVHQDHPYSFWQGNEEHRVDYVPGEGNTYLFGGNSNWRGPIWFPINYLLIEALERYSHFYGEHLKVEFPSGSGNHVTLDVAAKGLAQKLSSLFLPDEQGHRPCHGGSQRYAQDDHWKQLVLFYEYFHGDDGRGCGASHQTGWTALVLRCLDS